MGLDAWIVVSLLVFALALLVFTQIAADAVLVAVLTALMILPAQTDDGSWTIGILTVTEGLAGFSNSGMVTVGVLFIVVAGLRETGTVDWISSSLLGRPKTTRGALTRIIMPVCSMSAFLNNTPVVAMFIPAISDWARRLQIPPSKLMLPLSYAAILGGSCSLIGTSTNLVVAGLMTAEPGLPSVQMFDITWVGLPCAVLGTAFLVIVGPFLLPTRGSTTSQLSDARNYTMEMLVPPGSTLTGRTIEQAGLRHLPGCYLIEIQRAGDVLAAVGPEQLLHEGDRLVFVGVVESIRDLQNLRGLMPAEDQIFKLDSPRFRRRLFEAVISNTCPVVGKTIREGRFRTRYGAAVLAVSRSGERLQGKIGDIILHTGDVLLLETTPSFLERFQYSRDFLLVSVINDSTPRRHERAPIALAILVIMVALATIGWLSMLQAALLACGLMIITRCCTISQARASVDWSILIVIGAALGIGQALDKTGAASSIASSIMGLAGTNPWSALIAVYAVTALLTAIITNNAAVALTFPVALAASRQINADFMPFAMAIMMAGSASFATPLGYQTNLMVLGPGGYRFGDYLRLGLPMTFLMGAATVIIIPLIWHL